MNRLGAGFLLAALALGAAGLDSAAAQDLPPVPLEQPAPEPATSQFGMPLEGWVTVRYTVLADGTTEDVHAIDNVPAGIANKLAIDAVKRWRFEPATSNGVPVEWHNNEALVVFDTEEVPFEPSDFFTTQYLAVARLITAKQYEDAKKSNLRMQNMGMNRLREIGLAKMQAAAIGIALEDYHSAYAAILAATDPRVETLAPEELPVALQYRFRLEVETGRAVEALATFARLNEIAAQPDDSPLASTTAKIEAAMTPDAAIVVKGRGDGDPWKFALTRRTFSIDDVDGSVRGVEVECDRRATELEFQDDVEWSLPESWGACTVFVDTKRSTTFSLYEFE